MTLRRKAWMKCTWAVRTTGDHATGDREVRGEGSEGGSEGGARGGACVSFSSAGNACARTRTHVSSPPPPTGTHLLSTQWPAGHACGTAALWSQEYSGTSVAPLAAAKSSSRSRREDSTAFTVAPCIPLVCTRCAQESAFRDRRQRRALPGERHALPPPPTHRTGRANALEGSWAVKSRSKKLHTSPGPCWDCHSLD